MEYTVSVDSHQAVLCWWIGVACKRVFSATEVVREVCRKPNKRNYRLSLPLARWGLYGAASAGRVCGTPLWTVPSEAGVDGRQEAGLRLCLVVQTPPCRGQCGCRCAGDEDLMR